MSVGHGAWRTAAIVTLPAVKLETGATVRRQGEEGAVPLPRELDDRLGRMRRVEETTPP